MCIRDRYMGMLAYICAESNEVVIEKFNEPSKAQFSKFTIITEETMTPLPAVDVIRVPSRGLPESYVTLLFCRDFVIEIVESDLSNFRTIHLETTVTQKISLEETLPPQRREHVDQLAKLPGKILVHEDFNPKLICFKHLIDKECVLIAEMEFLVRGGQVVPRTVVVECTGCPIDLLSSYSYMTHFKLFNPLIRMDEMNYCFLKDDEWVILLDSGNSLRLPMSSPPRIQNGYMLHCSFHALSNKGTELRFHFYCLQQDLCAQVISIAATPEFQIKCSF
eukprot:TRINITY_DN8306_c0_g1_i10.p2 TRINITY_DN8306_c0_g1~~TRINITY_DN8306_c0_g1_i10.p2  ORF type:complete len:298 (+),score=25.66 TRINITY_DN8306_c0_g1_i10:61-894(+)